LNERRYWKKKILLKAEADYKTSLAKYQGLKKELELIGLNPEKMEFGSYISNITITAPIGGTITKVNATIGKYVFPEEVMFEIVNTDHLHVELGVFEKDILKVKEGQQIELRIPSSNGQVYQGEIYLVGKALDEESRTVNVHAHVEEGQAEFLPGMYVEAKILLESRNVQAVLEEAIVSGQDGKFIFIKASEDQDNDVYQKIPIETGIKSEQWVEITTMDSTYADHPVVVKGVYYLISNTSGI
jgi:cobalt-zinc-cadmium efflux system membrane fusion protein